MGLYAAYLQWRSRRDQRKLEDSYRQILDEAAERRKAGLTKTELGELESKVTQARNELSLHIPIEARRVFHSERKRQLASQISLLLGQYQATSERLSEAPDLPISSELRNAIERDLRPKGSQLSGRSSLWGAAFVVLLISVALPTALEAMSVVLEPIGERLDLPFTVEDLILYFVLLAGSFVVAATVRVASTRRLRYWHLVVAVGAALGLVVATFVWKEDLTSAGSIVFSGLSLFVFRSLRARSSNTSAREF